MPRRAYSLKLFLIYNSILLKRINVSFIHSYLSVCLVLLSVCAALSPVLNLTLALFLLSCKQFSYKFCDNSDLSNRY